MPSPQIQALAKSSGKSIAEVEKLFKVAKKIAKEQEHEDEFDYITGILKKMLKEDTPVSKAQEILNLTDTNEAGPYMKAAKEVKSFRAMVQNLEGAFAQAEKGTMDDQDIADIIGDLGKEYQALIKKLKTWA